MHKKIMMPAAAVCMMSAVAAMPADAMDNAADLPKGWLMWHSYSSYESRDSRLFVRAPEGTVTEITGSFVHPMNGSFGKTPDDIVFMAIDEQADEWDIFLCQPDGILNLTRNSGYRNEDPKWSPDGSSIVFKRGYWNHEVNDFTYDLALMDVESRTVTMLTDDLAENAMPCFSDDGKEIYYTRYTDGIGSICRLSLETGETSVIFAEEHCTAYYPICCQESLYFTKWYSAENRHDQLIRYDGQEFLPMPFNSEDADASDACPVGAHAMIYSSTADGSYSLYYYDGNTSVKLSDTATENNELGADFFPVEESLPPDEDTVVMGDVNGDGVFQLSDVVYFQKWLVNASTEPLPNEQAADFCQDGEWNIFDLVLMKRRLSGGIFAVPPLLH